MSNQAIVGQEIPQAVGDGAHDQPSSMLQTGDKGLSPDSLIMRYLLEQTEVFRVLCDLRQRGWNNPAGDKHFQRQRKRADEATAGDQEYFYKMMQQVGKDMGEATGVLSFERPLPSPHILDMCIAPGGFMAAALRLNPYATATTFSLPVDMGGHAVLLPDNNNIRHNFLDITMLAADMGMTDIPTEHPEAKEFITRKEIRDEDLFDLVFCDGQVLRTHKRSEAREKREAARLSTTQLALGLEHLRPGGRMVVLLHKVEMWSTVCVLHTFSRFARVRLYKPKWKWATRSSFYMIATDIQTRHESALAAIESYKLDWRVATFGTEEEYQELRLQKTRKEEVERTLKEFGTQLIRLGTAIWEIQAKALEKAPYVRGEPAQG